MDEKNEEKKVDPKKSESNLYGALSYLWVVSIIMLVMKKDDEFVKFHAKQGIVLFIATWFFWIPILGQILWIIAVLLSLLGFIKALTGEKYKMPVVGDIAEKFNV